MAPMTRRRFLMALAAAVGAGSAGVLVSRSGTETEAAAVSTTTSTLPSTTSTSAVTTVAPTTTEPPTTTSPPSTTLPPAGLQVICRDAWGALPVAGDFDQHTIERITVHHTAVLLDDNGAGPGRVRQHQEYHQSRGWPDLAYHYVIDSGGNIYEGRPVDAVGDTGTDYDPTGHFLVCCEGDFNQQEITPAQYESLVQMLAWGASKFGVDPAAIQGHRDLAATSCPGDTLYALIADGTLQSDVADAVGNVKSLNMICGSAGSDAVAAIESS